MASINGMSPAKDSDLEEAVHMERTVAYRAMTGAQNTSTEPSGVDPVR